MTQPRYYRPNVRSAWCIKHVLCITQALHNMSDTMGLSVSTVEPNHRTGLTCQAE